MPEPSKHKNLILICGSEDLLRENKRDELLKLYKAYGSMNFNAFSGSSIDLLEIRRLIDTVPMFEDKRKILITDSGLFKRSGKAAAKNEAVPNEEEDIAIAEAALAEAAEAGRGSIQEGDPRETFSDIPDSTVVIFCERSVDASSPMYKFLQKQGEVFRFDSSGEKRGADRKKNESDIRRWALEYLKREKRDIGGIELNRLLQIVGYDMMNLSTELEKLVCYTMAKPAGYRITSADIDGITSRTLSDRVFSMIDLKLKGRTAEALKVLEELFAVKTPPMKVLYLLVRQYEQALCVRECLSAGMSDAAVLSRMELKDWQLKQIKEQIRGVGADELKVRLENAAETEYRVKRGDLPDRLAVELMVIQ